jgi:hypothetical protein
MQGVSQPAFAALLLWLRITVLAILRQVLQAFYGFINFFVLLRHLRCATILRINVNAIP